MCVYDSQSFLNIHERLNVHIDLWTFSDVFSIYRFMNIYESAYNLYVLIHIYGSVRRVNIYDLMK